MFIDCLQENNESIVIELLYCLQICMSNCFAIVCESRFGGSDGIISYGWFVLKNVLIVLCCHVN